MYEEEAQKYRSQHEVVENVQRWSGLEKTKGTKPTFMEGKMKEQLAFGSLGWRSMGTKMYHHCGLIFLEHGSVIGDFMYNSISLSSL